MECITSLANADDSFSGSIRVTDQSVSLLFCTSLYFCRDRSALIRNALWKGAERDRRPREGSLWFPCASGSAFFRAENFPEVLLLLLRLPCVTLVSRAVFFTPGYKARMSYYPPYSDVCCNLCLQINLSLWQKFAPRWLLTSILMQQNPVIFLAKT